MDIKESAWAKLNLSLDVLGKRKDGYHDLQMVMISVSLHDDVTVRLRYDGKVLLRSNFAWLPADERNLAVKAARAFFSKLGRPDMGAEIQLNKSIPVGTGMAGGSSDAAAVLRALNTLMGNCFDLNTLRQIALQIGSDVPYCVAGGTMLAEGRGEQLTELPAVPQCSILICKPDFSISTAELFGRVDMRTSKTHPDTKGIIQALRCSDLKGISCRMYNVFEDVLPANCREILTIRSRLIELGALSAVMTGTGSAVFGVFEQEEKAEGAFQTMKKTYPECFRVKPV